MDEFHFARQQLIDPIAHQRVSLAPADFHQHPRPRDLLGDLLGERARNLRVAVLVDVFHASPSGGSGRKAASPSNPSSLSAPIWARYLNVRAASSWSTRLMAKPT